MLTLGILFCDRDITYLQDLLESIAQQVHVPYEIILLDNRTDTTSDISFLDSYTVLNKGQGNIYQLAGRKKIIENATGDFIWFIDCDDSLFEIDESFNEILKSRFDFISFSFRIKYSDSELFNEVQEKVIDGNLLLPEANNSPCCLWNKWIRTSVLRQVIQFIPDTARVSASEDLIYVLGALKYSQSQLQCSKYIYTFNSDFSCSGLNDYSGQIEKFRRCIFGLTEANTIIKSLMSESDLLSLEIDIEKSDCLFFLRKVFKTINKTDQQQMLEIIKNNFSENVINETWNTLLFSEEMTVKEFEQMDELLTSEFGDEIGTVENTTVFIWDNGTEETRTEREKIYPTLIKTAQ